MFTRRRTPAGSQSAPRLPLSSPSSLPVFCPLTKKKMFFNAFLQRFHLDWSVKHVVSVLSNHFKRAHTLVVPQFTVVHDRESLFWYSQIVFFLHASHSVMLLSWLSLQVGRAAAVQDARRSFSPPRFFFPLLRVVCARENGNKLSHFLMTPCIALNKPFSRAHSAQCFSSLFQRRAVNCWFILRHLQLILLHRG